MADEPLTPAAGGTITPQSAWEQPDGSGSLGGNNRSGNSTTDIAKKLLPRGQSSQIETSSLSGSSGGGSKKIGVSFTGMNKR